MRSLRPLSVAELLKVMPTDTSIAAIYTKLFAKNTVDSDIPQWSNGLAWNELHISTESPSNWD